MFPPIGDLIDEYVRKIGNDDEDYNWSLEDYIYVCVMDCRMEDALCAVKAMGDNKIKRYGELSIEYESDIHWESGIDEGGFVLDFNTKDVKV
jgi:hypothetical protein